MTQSAARVFWTFEDHLAYYRILWADALEVYSGDVFVRHFNTWQLGVGGVVISKQPLELNFARDAAESDCPVWSGIHKVIEALVIRELATARDLTDSQRKIPRDSPPQPRSLRPRTERLERSEAPDGSFGQPSAALGAGALGEIRSYPRARSSRSRRAW